jgi:hypothetical protein
VASSLRSHWVHAIGGATEIGAQRSDGNTMSALACSVTISSSTRLKCTKSIPNSKLSAITGCTNYLYIPIVNMVSKLDERDLQDLYDAKVRMGSK